MYSYIPTYGDIRMARADCGRPSPEEINLAPLCPRRSDEDLHGGGGQRGHEPLDRGIQDRKSKHTPRDCQSLSLCCPNQLGNECSLLPRFVRKVCIRLAKQPSLILRTYYVRVPERVGSSVGVCRRIAREGKCENPSLYEWSTHSYVRVDGPMGPPSFPYRYAD